MRRLLLIVPVLLAGCSVIHHRPARTAAPPRTFDLAAFFTGPTRGEGRLSVSFARAQPVHVRYVGHVEQGDLLVIDQDVVEGRKPSRHRQWRLRQTAPGLWIGSLSDADGPVVAEIAGPRATVTYPLKGNIGVRQIITLQPDGTTAVNRMEMTKAKLHLASLVETITKG